MKEQRLNQVLRDIAKHKVPDTIDVWPNLQNKLNSQTDISSQRPIFATRRLAWVAVLVTIFIFASVAYAFGPQILSLLKMDPTLDATSSMGLGHPLNLTQTHGDVLVTLEWAYADENRIAIAYSVHGDEVNQYRPVNLALFDNVGTEFPPFVGMGSTELSEAGVAPGQGEYVFSFDTSKTTDQPKDFDLHLEIVLESVHTSQPLSPFVFDFSIPSIPTSRIVEPKQTVTNAGITISLEKVVVTPAEVVTIMCLDVPASEYEGWSPISNIDVKSERAVVSATVGQTNHDDAGCISSRYFPSLYESHGSWTLTVTELVGFREGKPIDETSRPEFYVCSETESINSEYCSEQLRIQGPWVFEFELP